MESKDELLDEKDKVIAQLQADLAAADGDAAVKSIESTAEKDAKAAKVAGKDRLTELAGKLGGLADEVAAAGAGSARPFTPKQ